MKKTQDAREEEEFLVPGSLFFVEDGLSSAAEANFSVNEERGTKNHER